MMCMMIPFTSVEYVSEEFRLRQFGSRDLPIFYEVFI